jgi:hypothetical protein
MSAPVSTAASPAHYGCHVWQDEDGESYYLGGHVPQRRAIAAANRYARVECGLTNLADDSEAPLSWVTVRHVWWRKAEEDPYGEGWMEPCSANDDGAEAFTEVYL